jgi:AcrR family transcriptional regulator
MAHRKYEQTRRAQRQEDTRRRIVEAAMELHGTVGPLATTVSAVAERAGVERLTVYRHFPTTKELFHGCGTLFMETYPLPDLISETPPGDPTDRVRAVLGQLYAYFRQQREYFTVFLRDVEQIPDLQEFVGGNLGRALAQAGEWMVAGFGDVPEAALLDAIIRQSMDFWGWRSWMQQGLSDAQIIELVVGNALRIVEASGARR